MNAKLKKAKASVLTVGSGRGFVIEHGFDRLVITAAHCLPILPPATGASFLEERTYQGLLAPLDSQPSVCAECLFADPVADIAVLGQPDNQALGDEAEAYNELMKAMAPAVIGEAPKKGPAWLLSLNGNWFTCSARHSGGAFWLYDAAEGIKGGMSGSPIIAENGSAIGVVCLSMGMGGRDLHKHREGGGPRLVHHLPAWVLSGRKVRKCRSGERYGEQSKLASEPDNQLGDVLDRAVAAHPVIGAQPAPGTECSVRASRAIERPPATV